LFQQQWLKQIQNYPKKVCKANQAKKNVCVYYNDDLKKKKKKKNEIFLVESPEQRDIKM